jgi:uncharacterized protein YggE
MIKRNIALIAAAAFALIVGAALLFESPAPMLQQQAESAPASASVPEEGRGPRQPLSVTADVAPTIETKTTTVQRAPRQLNEPVMPVRSGASGSSAPQKD